MRNALAPFWAAAAVLGGCAQPTDNSSKESGAEASLSQPYEKAQAAVEAVPADLTTPDKALKSIWAVSDAQEQLQCAASKHLADRAERPDGRLIFDWIDPQPRADLVTGKVASYSANRTRELSACAPETYERTISEVKVESESRAVAVAKIRNTTPIPPGADDLFKEEREKGSTYRYVFTKIEGLWRLEDVISVGGYSDGESFYADAEAQMPWAAPPL